MDLDAKLETLKSMGIPEPDAREALARCDNDVEGAAEYIFGGHLEKNRLVPVASNVSLASSLPSYHDSFFLPSPQKRRRLSEKVGSVLKPSPLFPSIAPFLVALNGIPFARNVLIQSLNESGSLVDSEPHLSASYPQDRLHPSPSSLSRFSQQSYNHLGSPAWWFGEEPCVPHSLNARSILHLQTARALEFLTSSHRLYLDSTHITSAFSQLLSEEGLHNRSLSDCDVLTSFLSNFFSHPNRRYEETFASTLLKGDSGEKKNYMFSFSPSSTPDLRLSIESCFDLLLHPPSIPTKDWTWISKPAKVFCCSVPGIRTPGVPRILLTTKINLSKCIYENKEAVLHRYQLETDYKTVLREWEDLFNTLTGRKVTKYDITELLSDGHLLLKDRNSALANHLDVIKETTKNKLNTLIENTNAVQHKLASLYNDLNNQCVRRLRAVILEPSILYICLDQQTTKENGLPQISPSMDSRQWYLVNFTSAAVITDEVLPCDVKPVTFDEVELNFENHVSYHSRFLVYVADELPVDSHVPSIPNTVKQFIQEDNEYFDDELSGRALCESISTRSSRSNDSGDDTSDFDPEDQGLQLRVPRINTNVRGHQSRNSACEFPESMHVEHSKEEL
ncbi:UBA domain-containing protein Ucp6 [Schizosaccharomyces cryophilus OY26]|uniref:UBA domain-containing protein Ucp6 n=1 Tax=Schizosaccharomyces cryophilus (strain OY26 / ATCC MYA-4695 / CBS 11777 / NBRC 106824 / NRRL Y48691) TaxID=653667 RepID=S9W3Z6_SCHCR|nr:UBA domain-containing protein Ucp6 [Schizosaccharomyces cryophilus OY26]EPY53254.1 UBA domain-containing protein Ucp6 [Schizosaccharomyces cryophilus OY26]